MTPDALFYETETNAHGLKHDPFKAIVTPRPIGWIGTKAADGRLNLSPYSFFNAISDKPKLVMFSSSGRKDSVTNIEETGVFTCSLASRPALYLTCPACWKASTPWGQWTGRNR